MPAKELIGEEALLEAELHGTYLGHRHGPVCCSQHVWSQNRFLIACEAGSKVDNYNSPSDFSLTNTSGSPFYHRSECDAWKLP